MARPETMETVGENGGGRIGPLSCPNACRVEPAPPLHSRPGPLTTSGTGVGSPQLQSRGEAQTRRPTPTTSPTASRHPAGDESSRRTESSASGGEPDSTSEEPRDASSRQGALPDLLPHDERSSRASSPRRQPLEERRLAYQLRIIGDEFNAMVFRRAHAAPQWQEWRDVYRGFLNFIAQTLSALYRLT